MKVVVLALIVSAGASKPGFLSSFESLEKHMQANPGYWQSGEEPRPGPPLDAAADLRESGETSDAVDQAMDDVITKMKHRLLKDDVSSPPALHRRRDKGSNRFSAADANHDGALNRAEFGKAFGGHNAGVFHDMDADKNGLISKGEFQAKSGLLVVPDSDTFHAGFQAGANAANGTLGEPISQDMPRASAPRTIIQPAANSTHPSNNQSDAPPLHGLQHTGADSGVTAIELEKVKFLAADAKEERAREAMARAMKEASNEQIKRFSERLFMD